MNKYSDQKFTRTGLGIEALSAEDFQSIHNGTLEVLEQTGVRVDSQEARDIFEGGGCVVDHIKRIVKIPARIVEDAIDSAPSKYELCGRDPRKNYLVGTRVGFTNFGEALSVIDPYTKAERITTRNDCAQMTRVCDNIDEIVVYERACGCNDVPGQVQTIHNAEKIFSNTSKHAFIGSGNGYNCKKMLQLAYEASGGEENFRKNPIYSATVCPNSPLLLTPEVTEVIIESAKGGAPALIVSMTMSGATAPVTRAGAIVVHNCEVLSCLVLQQLTVKGSKALYGCSSLGFDLRFTTSPVGTPELALVGAAVCSLARYYNLPSFVAGG
jgi:trimethylamine--corrinoid protein Co-methyltransferase